MTINKNRNKNNKEYNTFIILFYKSDDGAIFSNIFNLGTLIFSFAIIFFNNTIIGTDLLSDFDISFCISFILFFKIYSYVNNLFVLMYKKINK